MSVGDLVRRRGFRILLVGQGVSALGDWMGTIAFMALALELTGSPTAVKSRRAAPPMVPASTLPVLMPIFSWLRSRG